MRKGYRGTRGRDERTLSRRERQRLVSALRTGRYRDVYAAATALRVPLRRVVPNAGRTLAWRRKIEREFAVALAAGQARRDAQRDDRREALHDEMLVGGEA